MEVPAYLQTSASPALLAQVIHTLDKRSRIRRAHTKDRSEVRGGGRRPWKQKGTGRSRHSTIRSPLWRGGGITFGPRSRKNRVAALPIRMRRKAFAGALADLVASEQVTIVRFDKAPTKTKAMAAFMTGYGRCLVLLSPEHHGLERFLRNIAGVVVLPASQATTKDVVGAAHVLIDEQALSILATRCSVV